MEWLIKTFNLNHNIDIRERNNCLYWACFSGHLNIAQLLFDIKYINTDDARAKNNRVLHMLCSRDNLDEAQWLVKTFDLNANDATSDVNISEKNKTTDWIIQKFNIW